MKNNVVTSALFDAHFLVLISITVADGLTILEISNVWRGGERVRVGTGEGWVGDVIC